MKYSINFLNFAIAEYLLRRGVAPSPIPTAGTTFVERWSLLWPSYWKKEIPDNHTSGVVDDISGIHCGGSCRNEYWWCFGFARSGFHGSNSIGTEFFNQYGADTGLIRRVALQCARFSKTPITFFLDEPITDLMGLMEVMNEVSEEERKRIERK